MVLGGKGSRKSKSSRKSGSKSKHVYSQDEFFCMKEKKPVHDPNYKMVKSKNGKNRKQGKCPDCGCKLNKFC